MKKNIKELIIKNAVRLVFLVAIVLLGIKLWNSILLPIKFQEKKSIRYGATIKRLKDIRKAEVAYKAKHGKFTGYFDTLIDFIKTDSFTIVKAIGTVPEEFMDSLKSRRAAEELALKLGLIRRDSITIGILDSLFPPPYPIDSIRYVPFTSNEKFILKASTFITPSEVKVPVFEAKVTNWVVLNGLDSLEIINTNAEAKKLNRYKGLKVGDIEEPNNNSGNWE